ncbi:MAG: Bax inhibitor-1/YccA family protein [Defluviitaleaceae bacterium]|nr:Bax inhibitor-1/YccA family protein [Defluviitaleaceae bacterium]
MNFRNNYENLSYVSSAGLNRHIAKVYGWTFAGLLTTAAVVIFFITGLYTAPAVFGPFLETSMNLMLLIAIAQMILVFFMSSRLHKMAPIKVKILYLTYSASMGILFTFIALVYELQTIGIAFLITSLSFGAMAVYGILSKQDLTSHGNILRTAIIGLVIASVVNIFLVNSMLDFIITVSGIFIFLGMTVYDSNKIKHLYTSSIDSYGEATALTENLAIYSSLSLYLNFINLFMFILRFLSRGSRN